MSSFQKLLLALIILLAAFLRFYQLGSNPPSLYWDEVSNGYDAYSILKTGKDQYGQAFPLTFRALDDFRPGAYIYAIIPSVAILGLNELAVRTPSALLGTISVFLTFLLAKNLFKNDKIALLASLFLAISPWHLQFSRGGFEANLMQTCILLGIVTFIYSFKKPYLIIFSAIAFGIALHSYQAAKIAVPLFIIALFLVYKKEILKLSRLLLVLVICLLFLSSLPILSNWKENSLRAQSVSIFRNSKNPFDELRKAYLSHFSANFLFFRGDTIGRHLPSQMGELFVFEAFLIPVGLYYFLKVKERKKYLILSWLFLAPIPASLSVPYPHALRSITFIPAWSIISASGLYVIWRYQTQSLKFFKKALLVFLFTLAFYNFSSYLHAYYIHYPKEKGPDWQDGYREAALFIKDNQQKYQKIVFSNRLGQAYIYTLFYLQYDPKIYQQNVSKKSFDKFVFFDKPSDIGEVKGKVLFITSPYQGHPNNILKEIKDQGDRLVFTISETE